MPKNTIPIPLKVLLILSTALCSLSNALIIPATAFFTVLCITSPGPILVIAPFLSIISSLVIGFLTSDFGCALTYCASSLSYLLASVLISAAYLKKQSKFSAVLNGCVGLSLYEAFCIVINFVVTFGKFSPQLLNQVLDAHFNTFRQNMLEITSSFQSPAIQQPDSQVIEQLFDVMKPLMPAYVVASLFVFAYLTVCLTNFLLKKLKVIENNSYRLLAPRLIAILFFVAYFLNIFVAADHFISVLLTSVVIILMPMFTLTGFGVIKETIMRFTKNSVLAVIIMIVLVLLLGDIVYNLFYLVGCYYSIMVGGKNKWHKNFKGENQ